MKVFILSLFSLTLMVGCKASHKNSSGSTSPKDENSAALNYVEKTVCELKGEERDLEIHVNGGTACEVFYKKGRDLKSVAYAVSGPGHCRDVVKKMKGKLASAGWKCK